MPVESLVDTNPRESRPQPITAEEAGAVVNLFRLWDVTDDQAARPLGLSVRTHRRWKQGGIGRIDGGNAPRLSNLLGIHKAPRLILQEPTRAHSWMKAPNAGFAGRSALDVPLDGEPTSLTRVRRHLDAERDAW